MADDYSIYQLEFFIQKLHIVQKKLFRFPAIVPDFTFYGSSKTFCLRKCGASMPKFLDFINNIIIKKSKYASN